MNHGAMPLTVLSDTVIRSLLDEREVIDIVRDAFAADGRGQAAVLPVVGHSLNGGRYSIKTSHLQLSGHHEVFGLKMGSYYPDNVRRGLPTHSAVMLMGDPVTGQPHALLAANVITEARTAAAGAVAAQMLSRPDAQVVALFGTGGQALAQLRALQEVRSLKEVRVWSRTPERAEAFVEAADLPGLAVRAVPDGQAACEDADIVVTVTPAEEPIISRQWIRPGTHINAMGSDAPGKQELDPYLVAVAKVVVDRRAQSLTIGEMQRPVALQLVQPEDIYAELGELCAGLKPGREHSEEITVFDSTGVSFQDTALAGHLLRLAEQRCVGEVVSL
ncbi:ornithine cyclodeaminase family protein [Deinococcus deserti]|uniref:Putative Ornithine cyclodeaminase n=1 Tax=Deinococcus deserti (strain DSM 17065 / CIP 109153 / LMG 22923 / VCD115) TaxID=546414 RepID=C1D3X2_DEIDV|nr:ornithine cyclodeaminase family protein [Deinococcus deserti]ACO48201.1 putative Ornithine cyclodeaminase [Deinococcus deserti VCD115]